MEPPKARRVRVVRVKGKEGVLEVLRGLLADFEYRISYDVVVDEDSGVVYKYEELHVTGQVSGEYVAVTCNDRECRVEAPIYTYSGVEPCFCKSEPAEVADCIKNIVSNVVRVKNVVRSLHAMASELEQQGFQVDLLGTGAEAYYYLGGGSYVRVHLSTRASLIQLQLQTDPARVVELAKRLVEILGGG